MRSCVQFPFSYTRGSVHSFADGRSEEHAIDIILVHKRRIRLWVKSAELPYFHQVFFLYNKKRWFIEKAKKDDFVILKY